jgi:hypothetical protein
VEAYPQPTIVWIFKTNTKIQNILNTSRISVLSTDVTIEEGHPFSRSQLTINNVNSNDSGDYVCIATAADEHSTAQSRVHSVTVTSKKSTSTLFFVVIAVIIPPPPPPLPPHFREK